MKTKVVKVKATTNNITKAVVNFLLSQGHTASRVNTQGTYDEAQQRFIKSGSRNGFSDISAGIKGSHRILDFDKNEKFRLRFCQYVAIEIKKGADKMRPDQLDFKREVEAAGGVYLEVKTYDDFMIWYREQYWIENNQPKVVNL